MNKSANVSTNIQTFHEINFDNQYEKKKNTTETFFFIIVFISKESK